MLRFFRTVRVVCTKRFEGRERKKVKGMVQVRFDPLFTIPPCVRSGNTSEVLRLAVCA